MEKSNFTLKVTLIASEDLDEIYSYISYELFNEDAADHLMEKIETSIMRLKDFPFSCSFVDDEILKSKGYRKLIVENYIVFYLVSEKEKVVVVMRVLYGKQKYEDLI